MQPFTSRLRPTVNANGAVFVLNLSNTPVLLHDGVVWLYVDLVRKTCYSALATKLPVSRWQTTQWDGGSCCFTAAGSAVSPSYGDVTDVPCTYMYVTYVRQKARIAWMSVL